MASTQITGKQIANGASGIDLTVDVTGTLPIANGGTGNTTGSAATLTTARTIQTNLASTTAVSFNGSANITPGVTGTLPVANGGTGSTTKNFVDLTTAQTVAGVKTFSSAITSNLATGTAPLTVASTTKVTNLNADMVDGFHASATATASNLMPLDANAKISASLLTNPYKFSVYRTAALNSAATDTAIAFDTKLFDTGSNVDIVTNKGRFTAPVAGFYWFSASAGNTLAASTMMRTSISVNGSLVKIGNQGTWSTNANISTVSALVQLNANDNVEATFVGGSGSVMYVGISQCWFTGFLVSTT